MREDLQASGFRRSLGSGNQRLALLVLGRLKRILVGTGRMPLAPARQRPKLTIDFDISPPTIIELGQHASRAPSPAATRPTNPESKVFPPGAKGLTLEQALAAVTTAPAWQIRMEDKIGSLEVGKYL